jgi:deoxyribonuclease IV
VSGEVLTECRVVPECRLSGEKMKELLVGSHMSIAGGIHNAFGHAERAGCRALQVFLKSSNQWKGKPLIDADRLRFQSEQARTGIDSVVAHNSYLINLASPDAALYEKSIAAFVEEMERANFIGVPAVILHPGAHMGAGIESGIERVAEALNRSLEEVPPPVRILLETTAGQGSSIGHRFEQLAAIMDRVRAAERVGICLDTCHVFAAGYDIRTEPGYRRTMREFQKFVGLDRIAAFHVNDCKKELGSRVDRHTHIGQGTIGLEAFRCLVNDRRFARIPKILETPKGDDLEEDRMNLAILRGLVRARK